MNKRSLGLIVGPLLFGASMALGGCSDDDDAGGSGGTAGSSGGSGGGAGTGGSTGGSAGSTGGSAGSGGSAATAGAGGLGTGQIDRMGRPAIATALIPADKKDGYNAAAQSTWASYQADMEASLEGIDNLDGDKTNGLLAANRAALAGLIADDQLQIDISIDDCTNGYLALELQVAGNCGGRSLSEDIIDKTLQSLVDATATTQVTDAVGSNDKAFSDAFPYLADPH